MAASRAGRLRVRYTGPRGSFAVWSLGPKGGKKELLVNEIGAYTGTVAYLASAKGRGRVSGFSVEADGPWGMTPKSLASSPVLRKEKKASGTGDYVMRFRKTTRLRASHLGGSNFAVVTLSRTGEYNTLLVNEIGRYRATTVVPRAARYIVITADGPWTVRRP